MFKKEDTMREITIYNEKIKSQSMLHFKSATIIIFISAILYCFINFNASAYCAPISEIGDTWSKILTPFNSYIGDVSPYHLDGHEGTHINKKNYYFTIPGIYQEYVEGSMIRRVHWHGNWIARFLSFGNTDIMYRSSLAAMLGDFQIPYCLFIHEKNGSVYLAKELNAAAVLLYGYSWIINIPAKFLNTWDFFIENYQYFPIGMKIKMTLDLIWSFIITLIIELPLAIINTLIGFIIAFIFHPINSLLAIPCCIYYFIISSINAIWGIVANIVMIPIHIIS